MRTYLSVLLVLFVLVSIQCKKDDKIPKITPEMESLFATWQLHYSLAGSGAPNNDTIFPEAGKETRLAFAGQVLATFKGDSLVSRKIFYADTYPQPNDEVWTAYTLTGETAPAHIYRIAHDTLTVFDKAGFESPFSVYVKMPGQ
jgi:hypothetical protein